MSRPRPDRMTVFVLIALGLAAAAAPARADVFHVDRASTACANAGPGTEAEPYCSIAAAVAARGGPGVTILVAPGVYREQVRFAASGAPERPLVLKAAADGVMLDGADDFSDAARWTRHAGDVWLAPGVTWDPVQVFADGTRLTPSDRAPEAIPARAYRWVSGTGLFVNLGGGSPAALGLRAGRRSHGFVMYGRSWITIEGFHVTGTQDRGIYVAESSTDIAILGNTVTFAGKMGIQVVGGSGIRVAANTVSDNLDHGISMRSAVTNSVVEDNESCRNARPGQRAANGIYLFDCPGNVLRRNRLHHNQDSGMDLQHGSNDCVSYLNWSWSNGDHGFDHLAAAGTLHACDLAWGNHRDGFSMEGDSPGTRLYNSIAVDNGLETGHFDLWVDASSIEGFVSDHNLFWNSTRQAPVKYVDTAYGKLAAYRAASGQDARSLQTDPRFVNAAAGDFRLQPGSPALPLGDIPSFISLR